MTKETPITGTIQEIRNPRLQRNDEPDDKLDDKLDHGVPEQVSSMVQVTPQGLITFKSELLIKKAEVFGIETDIIAYDPAAKETRVLLSETGEIPQTIVNSVDKEWEHFGHFRQYEVMADGGIAAVHVLLPDDFTQWPSYEEFSSMSLSSWLPRRAFLARYRPAETPTTVGDRQKETLDLTKLFLENPIKLPRGIGGDASRSMWAENPLHDPSKESLESQREYAITYAGEMRCAPDGTIWLRHERSTCHLWYDIFQVIKPTNQAERGFRYHAWAGNAYEHSRLRPEDAEQGSLAMRMLFDESRCQSSLDILVKQRGEEQAAESSINVGIIKQGYANLQLNDAFGGGQIHEARGPKGANSGRFFTPISETQGILNLRGRVYVVSMDGVQQ